MRADDEPPVSLAKAPDGVEGDAVPGDVPAETPLAAVVTGAAYGALALLGLVWALVGAFAENWTVASLPIPAAVLALANFALARTSGWAMGSRLGAFVPAAVWVVVTLVLSMKLPEGDLVIGGTLSGYVYILGGMGAAVGGWLATPAKGPSGSWLTRGAPGAHG